MSTVLFILFFYLFFFFFLFCFLSSNMLLQASQPHYHLLNATPDSSVILFFKERGLFISWLVGFFISWLVVKF